MPEEADNEADLGAFMEHIEEPYIDNTDYNVQGLYNLKSSELSQAGKGKGPLALSGRKSYDYVPQYLIKAAEEQIEKYYNPETKTLALPSTPEPLRLPSSPEEKFKAALEEAKKEESQYVYGVTKGPRFRRAYGMDATEPEAEKRTYQKNGQKITEEVVPIVSTQTASSVSQPLAGSSAISPSQGAPVPQPTELEKPIAAFTGPAGEEKLREMVNEIERLKKEQENLKRIRDMKIERLRLKWQNIAAGIKAKHPVITSLIEKAVKAAPGIAKSAISAGRSFARGLGNLATKLADPYQRQGLVNSLDYATRDFAPEGSFQNPIDRINGIRFVPPQRQAPTQGIPQRPTHPVVATNSDLEKEAERLRLNRSIIRQRAQLANQKAQIEGKPLPYPNVPIGGAGTKRKRTKSLREVLKELSNEKTLATA